LSFKIILIRKSQVSIFIKYLKLFEFENVFVFKLCFELKFKICLKEFAMQFLFFFFGWPKAIQPKSPSPSAVFGPSGPLLQSSPSLGRQRHRHLSATTGTLHPSSPLTPPLSAPPSSSPPLGAVSMHESIETKALKSSTNTGRCDPHRPLI
jgi:hypothetical protein